MLEPLFNGVVILLKETPTEQHRCFPVNIAKFSRTPILKKIFEKLPLEFLRFTVNISSYNPWQNIWNKIEKSSKTGQGKKSSISLFCMFFDCYCQSLNSGRETGH